MNWRILQKLLLREVSSSKRREEGVEALDDGNHRAGQPMGPPNSFVPTRHNRRTVSTKYHEDSVLCNPFT